MLYGSHTSRCHYDYAHEGMCMCFDVRTQYAPSTIALQCPLQRAPSYNITPLLTATRANDHSRLVCVLASEIGARFRVIVPVCSVRVSSAVSIRRRFHTRKKRIHRIHVYSSPRARPHTRLAPSQGIDYTYTLPSMGHQQYIRRWAARRQARCNCNANKRRPEAPDTTRTADN